MFVSQIPPTPADLHELSRPSRVHPHPASWLDGEDSCTVRRPPLAATDPAIWPIAAILFGTVAWLIA